MAAKSPGSPDLEHRDPRVDVLEQRIEEIAHADESEFGAFTRLDWVICAIGSGLLPALALWWWSG